MQQGKRPGVQINWTSMFFLCAGGGMLLYFIYSALPPFRIYHMNKNLTWRKHTHYTIPNNVRDKMTQDIEIKERMVDIMVENERATVAYLEAQPQTTKEVLSVVFLHGMGDSSKNWQAISSLNLVVAMGFRAIALDLPGHGRTKGQEPHDRGKFLATFLEKLEIRVPVIVAASMGGSYALPYIMGDKPLDCHRRVTGFVPIAITTTSRYGPAQYNHCDIPTMIVYGVNDTNLGLHSVGDLRNLKNREIIPIEKAGHACHHEQPDEWNLHLYNFLKHIEEDLR